MKECCGEECCREVLGRSVVEKRGSEVLENNVVEKCCREVLAIAAQTRNADKCTVL